MCIDQDSTLVYFCIIGIDNVFLPEGSSSGITIKMYKENYFDNVSVITCMKNEIKFFFPKYLLYILWFISIIYGIADYQNNFICLFLW